MWRRVDGDDMRVRRRQRRVLGNRRPRGQCESADAVAQGDGALAGVRSDREHRPAARHQVAEQPRDAASARVVDGSGLRLAALVLVAARFIDDGRVVDDARLVSRRKRREVTLQLGAQSCLEGRSAEDLDRPAVRRLSVAEHQPRLDGAVVAVHLEAYDRVQGRLAVAGSEPPRPNATQRERAPPAASENETWRPSPIARGSSSSALGIEQRRPRGWTCRTVPDVRAPRETDVEHIARHDGVDWAGPGSDPAGVRAAVGSRRRTPRETRRRARVATSARQRPGGRRGAAARRLRRRARRAGRRRGSNGLSRCPHRRRARSAPPVGDGARRYARPRRRSPPDASPPPASTYGGAPGGALRDLLLSLQQDPRLHVSPLDVGRVQLVLNRACPHALVGERSSSPASARYSLPAALIRGASRKPIAPASIPLGSTRATSINACRPGLRVGRAPQPLAHQSPVLVHERHAVGDRGERDEVEVGVGVRGVPPRRRAARGRAGARRRWRTAPDTGSRRQPGGRSARRAAAVGARRVVVRDHHVETGGARRGDLVDGGDRAVDRDKELRAACGQPLDRGEREPNRRRSGWAGTSRHRRQAPAAPARARRWRRRRRRRSRRERLSGSPA